MSKLPQKESDVVTHSVTLPRSLSERIKRICQQSERPFTYWARVVFRAAVEKDEQKLNGETH